MDRLTAMETFTRVVETGSFSSAARCLNVGQPAVSKSVALLEERLGVRLLLRSTRGLTPTDAGQNFYESARRIIEQADQADLTARGSGSSLCGPLRVSGAITFAQRHIWLWTFHNDGCDVSVAVGGRVRVTAVEGVRAAVLAGIGIAVSPEWVFAPELASGAVREVLTEWSLPPVDLWAVFPSGRMVSAKARAFVAFVKQAMDQAL